MEKKKGPNRCPGEYMKNFNKIILTLLILSFAFPAICGAQKLSKSKNNSLPIEITSEKMISDQKTNKIVFTGSVVAKQGKLTIFSDKMTVYNDKKRKKIDRIVARGNVRIEKEDRSATGENAVYIEKEGRITLTGNPRAWENNNEIIATEMIFLVDEDRFIVKGSKENKIKLTFFPEEKNGKKD